MNKTSGILDMILVGHMPDGLQISCILSQMQIISMSVDSKRPGPSSRDFLLED